jgi:hypothetical protein
MTINEEGKIVIRVNASSLKESTCITRWTNTIIHGYHGCASSAAAVYGTALHKYIDTMFKTDGDMRRARDRMLETFRLPKVPAGKNSQHLEDERHLIPTAFNVWDDLVMKDTNYEVMKITSKCWWCGGVGRGDGTAESLSVELGNQILPPCEHCNGTGMKEQPATEVTFSIKFYEDAFCVIYLEGTADTLGKIKGGCYAIRDFKTTSQYKKDEYLRDYEMSPQLKFYTLAWRLMAEQFPDSLLGQTGATNTGVFIDGIFLKARIVDIEYQRSAVFIFTEDQIASFKRMLLSLCGRLSAAAVAIKTELALEPEGLLNGSCKGEWGKCQYWNACMAGSNYQRVLDSTFKKKEYNPLKHQDV